MSDQQPEAPAAPDPLVMPADEFAMLKRGAAILGSITARLYRTMEAARIEMLQNGPHAGMQWVLNSLPDVFEDDKSAWDGAESAQAWFDRAEAADRAAEASAVSPPPVAAALDPANPVPSAEALRAYLDVSGWTRELPGPEGSVWSRDGQEVAVPSRFAPGMLRGVLDRVAHAEGRAAADVVQSVLALRRASQPAKGCGCARLEPCDAHAEADPSADPSQPPPAAPEHSRERAGVVLAERAERSVGIALIRAERARQVAVEGWTPEHDAHHTAGELARAAACYAAPPEYRKTRTALADGRGDDRGDRYRQVPQGWPWHPDHWKPGDRLGELVKAGALLAAEIDRLAGNG